MNKNQITTASVGECPAKVEQSEETNTAAVAEAIVSTGKIPATDDQRKTVQQLIEAKGQPFLLNEQGKLNRVNEAFWAALILTEHHLLWEPNEGQFYLYKGEKGLWKEYRVEKLQQLIGDRLLQAARDIKEEGLERCRQLSTLNAIITNIKGIRSCPGVFSGERKAIHLENGMLKLDKEKRAFEFVSFSPDFFSRNQSPIVYDKMATCSRFLGELVNPALEDADALLFQKHAGQCILGTNLTHRMLIMHGAGAAGKSTLTNVVVGLIGEVNKHQLKTDQLGGRFEIGRYHGKNLLVGSDVKPDFLNKSGATHLKSLIGGDYLEGEKKCLNERIPIRGNFNVLINCNERLTVNVAEDESAWSRRLLIVEFKKPNYAKKIDGFAELLLKEEASGILNWALDGLFMLWEDLEKIGDFDMSPTQKKRIENMLGESESVRHFVQNCLVRGHGNITKEEFKEAYVAYCVKMGWVPKVPRKLSAEMDEVMARYMGVYESRSIIRHGVATRGFSGVILKTQAAVQVEQEIEVVHEEAMAA